MATGTLKMAHSPNHWNVDELRRLVMFQVLKERLSALATHAGRRGTPHASAHGRWLRVGTAQVQGWQGQDS